MSTLAKLVVSLGLESKTLESGLTRIEGKAKGVGRTFQKVGAGMSAAFTLPAIAVGASLLKIGENYDSMSDTIAIKTGATGKELEGLNQTALNVFKSIPTTMEETGNAIGFLNQKLGITGPALEGLARSEIELARITKTDLNAVMGSSTDVFNSWGVSVDDQVGTLDKFFRASQASGIGVDVLLQQVNDAGPTFRNLGLNIDQSLALLAAFGKSGLDTGTLVSGLKKAVVTFTNEGLTDMNQALTDTINNILAAPDATSAAALAISVFGAKAGPQLADAIRSGTVSYEDLLAIITGGDGTILDAADKTDDLAEKWQVFKNRLTVAVLPAANKLFAWVNSKGIPMADKWAGRIERLTKWFSGLSGGVQKSVLVFGLLLAAAGPVLVILGTLAGAIGSITALFGAQAVASDVAAAALLTEAAAAEVSEVATTSAWLSMLGPIALVIALIALFVIAYKKNWLGIGDITRTVVRKVIAFIQPVLDVFKLLGDYWHDVATNKIQPGNFAKLPGWLQPIAFVIARIIKTLRVFLVTWKTQGFIAALKTIPTQIRAFGRAIAKLLDSIGLSHFADAIKEQFYLVAKLFTDVISLVDNLVHGRWRAALGDLGKIAVDLIKLGWSQIKASLALWRDLGGLLVGLIISAAVFMRDKGGPWLAANGEKLFRVMLAAIVDYTTNTIIPWIKTVPGQIADLIKAGTPYLLEAGSAIISFLQLGLSLAWIAAWQWIKSAAMSILTPFANMYNAFVGVGSAIAHGIVDGLSAGWDAIKAWGQKIVNYYNRIAGIVPGMSPIGGGGDAGANPGVGGGFGGASLTNVKGSSPGSPGSAGMGGVQIGSLTVHSNSPDPVVVAHEVARVVMAEVGRVQAGAVS